MDSVRDLHDGLDDARRRVLSRLGERWVKSANGARTIPPHNLREVAACAPARMWRATRS